MRIHNKFKTKSSESGCGVKSFASWRTIELEVFEKLFALRPNEKVVAITVDENGVEATIEKK